MSRFWIVAADHSGARVLATDKRAGPVQEVSQVEHPEGRLKEQEFGGRKPEAGFASAGHGEDILNYDKTHKRNDEERFARELAEYLDKARTSQKFEELYLVSEPRFLGALRNALPDELRKTVKGEVSKNVTQQSPEQIRKQLPDLL